MNVREINDSRMLLGTLGCGQCFKLPDPEDGAIYIKIEELEEYVLAFNTETNMTAKFLESLVVYTVDAELVVSE